MIMKKTTVSRVCLVILMILMFIFSNQKGETSSKVSNTVAEVINIEPDNKWIEPSVQPIMLGLNLRKYAHIIIYFLMGVSAYYALKESIGLRKRVLYSSIICYGYAVFDEIHQFFVPGRTAGIVDTFVDAVGFLIAISICVLLTSIWKKRIRK